MMRCEAGPRRQKLAEREAHRIASRCRLLRFVLQQVGFAVEPVSLKNF